MILNSMTRKKFFSDHHLSHASSAFPSPFEEAVVLTADGVGEWPTTTVAVGKGNALEIKEKFISHILWGYYTLLLHTILVSKLIVESIN